MDWIVFGLGKSVRLLPRREATLCYNTIGVNTIDEFHTVNHLVIPDKWDRFIEPRRKIIAATQADTVWLRQLREFPGLEHHPDIRRFHSTLMGHETDEFFEKGTSLPHCFTSPFLATAIAWKFLRAERIGILGMDMLSDHTMHKNQPLVNAGFVRLREMLLRSGTEVVNLSPIANIPALPLKPIEFIRKKS